MVMSHSDIESKLDAVIASIIDGIGASAMEEKLQVPARLKKARSEAFNEGYASRDKELQPLIRESGHERELLKNKIVEQERQVVSLHQSLTAKEQDLAKLRSERDKLKASHKQKQLTA